MIVITIFLLVITEIFACDPDRINVGTVLFSPEEGKKQSWSATNIGLLNARKYFQHMIPPPSLVDPSMDHFADTILDYFTDAVDCVKREETDPITSEILTTALSDTIGGYMKAFVIPVAKYGYYGGTVTKGDAQKIYQFYNDILEYLKTDGAQWRSFDGNFQKPLQIIATLPVDNARPTRDYCAQLTLYEETPSGYTIPLPTINFNTQTPVMYVPLKGSSIIELDSPSSSDALLNYYQAAKKCLKTRSPSSETNFDNRFHTWLTGDVIAHIGDEDNHLFYALGGILTLADVGNSTAKDKFTRLPTTIIQTRKRPHKPYLHINFASKKIMFLAILLFLEVVWCIPALLYMLYTRRRKKKQVGTNLFFVVNPKNDNSKEFLTSSGNATETCTETIPSNSPFSQNDISKKMKMYKKRYLTIKQELESGRNVLSQTSDVSKHSKSTSNHSCSYNSKLRVSNSYEMKNEYTSTPVSLSSTNQSQIARNANPSMYAGLDAKRSEITGPRKNPSVGTGPGGKRSEITGPSKNPSECTGPSAKHSELTGPSKNPSVCTEPRDKHSEITGPSKNHSVCTGPSAKHSELTGPSINPSVYSGLCVQRSETTGSSKNPSLGIGPDSKRSEITGPSKNPSICTGPYSKRSHNTGPSVNSSLCTGQCAKHSPIPEPCCKSCVESEYCRKYSQNTGTYIKPSLSVRHRTSRRQVRETNVNLSLEVDVNPSLVAEQCTNRSQITGPSLNPSLDTGHRVNCSKITESYKNVSLDSESSINPSRDSETYGDCSKITAPSLNPSLDTYGNSSQITESSYKTSPSEGPSPNRSQFTRTIIDPSRIDESPTGSNKMIVVLESPLNMGSSADSHMIQPLPVSNDTKSNPKASRQQISFHLEELHKEKNSLKSDGNMKNVRYQHKTNKDQQKNNYQKTCECKDSSKLHRGKYSDIDSKLSKTGNFFHKTRISMRKNKDNARNTHTSGENTMQCPNCANKSCDCKQLKTKSNLGAIMTHLTSVAHDYPICATPCPNCQDRKCECKPVVKSNLGAIMTHVSHVSHESYDTPLGVLPCPAYPKKPCECRFFKRKSNQGLAPSKTSTDDVIIQRKHEEARIVQSCSTRTNSIGFFDKQKYKDTITFDSKPVDDDCMIFSKFDSHTKVKRNGTDELIQLINAGTLLELPTDINYENLTDLPTYSSSSSESDTKIDELRACATMTLLADEDSSEKSTKTVLTGLEEATTSDENDIKCYLRDMEQTMHSVQRSLKMKASPLFGITIEKQHASICVDITTGNHKVSKIPTRVISNEPLDQDTSFHKREFSVSTGSKIPLPVKKTTDDIVIKTSSSEATASDPRLNASF